MSDEPRMRDIPMLDADRELLRSEIEGFDDMTMEEMRAAAHRINDDVLDAMNVIKESLAPTYNIVRFFEDANRPNEIISEGVTLDYAREHCQRDDTHGTTEDGVAWFDGYQEADA